VIRCAFIATVLLGTALAEIGQCQPPHAATMSPPVIACETMTKAETLFGTALVATFGTLLAVTTPYIARDAAIVLWLAFLALCIGYALHLTRRYWIRSMTVPLIIGIGGILGLLAGAIVAFAFPAVALEAESGLSFAFSGVVLATTDPRPDEASLVLLGAVKNTGEPSYAEDWKVEAELADGRVVKGKVIHYRGPNEPADAAPPGSLLSLELDPNEQLVRKLAAAIPKGGPPVNGHIATLFEGVGTAEFARDCKRLSLSFKDAYGHPVVSFFAFDEPFGRDVRFPGMLPSDGPFPQRNATDVAGQIDTRRGIVPRTGNRINTLSAWIGDNVVIIQRLPHVIVAVELAQDEYERMLSLEMGPDGLLLSATCFDEKGDALCVIERNQFVRNPENTFRIGGDAHRLIVYGKQNQVLIDIGFTDDAGGSRLRLKGDFYVKNGHHVVIDEKLTSAGRHKAAANLVVGGALIILKSGIPTLGAVPWEKSQ
jgi:hypothetical protein